LGKVGEVFSPAYHEALGRDAVDSVEMDNTVTAVLEKGWKVGPSMDSGSSTVIRPAKVRVAHFANEKQEA